MSTLALIFMLGYTVMVFVGLGLSKNDAKNGTLEADAKKYNVVSPIITLLMIGAMVILWLADETTTISTLLMSASVALLLGVLHNDLSRESTSHIPFTRSTISVTFLFHLGLALISIALYKI